MQANRPTGHRSQAARPLTSSLRFSYAPMIAWSAHSKRLKAASKADGGTNPEPLLPHLRRGIDAHGVIALHVHAALGDELQGRGV